MSLQPERTAEQNCGNWINMAHERGNEVDSFRLLRRRQGWIDGNNNSAEGHIALLFLHAVLSKITSNNKASIGNTPQNKVVGEVKMGRNGKNNHMRM